MYILNIFSNQTRKVVECFFKHMSKMFEVLVNRRLEKLLYFNSVVME